MIPIGLLSDPDLSDGAKALWARLYWLAGSHGECSPRADALASQIGKSVDTIGRLISELIQGGYIQRLRRGPNRPHAYRFLEPATLSESVRKPQDTADLRSQGLTPQVCGVSEPETPQICGDDTADLRTLRPQICGALRNKKDRRNLLEKSSSSRADVGAAAVATTTTNHSPDWRASSIEAHRSLFRELLRLRTREVERDGVPAPDSAILGEILAQFEGPEDLQAYADSFRRDRGKAVSSYAFFVVDARDYWPGRRAVLDRATANAQALSNPAVEVGLEPEINVERVETEPREPEPVRPPAPCRHCRGMGYVGARGGGFDWCACGHAVSKRSSDPLMIEKLRRDQADFEQKLAALRIQARKLSGPVHDLRLAAAVLPSVLERVNGALTV
ncbi:MAG: helix-turn-helix domain-containing protein [Bryobacteraceae bacterium]